jgi:hypothetical protein
LAVADTKKKPPEPSPPPKPATPRPTLDPTRYNDWEKGGRCIDF